MNSELKEYIQTKINQAKEKLDGFIELDSKWSPNQIENTLKELGWKCNGLIRSGSSYQTENYEYSNYRHYRKYLLTFGWNGWTQEKYFGMIEK